MVTRAGKMKRAAMEPSSADVMDLELTKAHTILDRFSRHFTLRKSEGRVFLMEAAAYPQPLSAEKLAEGYAVDPLAPSLAFADSKTGDKLGGEKLRCYRVLDSYPAGAASFAAKWITTQVLAEMEAGVASGCECMGDFGSVHLTLRLPRLPHMTAEIRHNGGAVLPGGFAPGTQGFDSFFSVPTDGSRACCCCMPLRGPRALMRRPANLPLPIPYARS